MELERLVEASSMVEEFEVKGKKAGLLLLTTALSRPFRRLGEYSGLLQELYRHLPEEHRDRGDTHRAAKVLAEIAVSSFTFYL